MIQDESMTEEARRFLLKGEGKYEADGMAASLGFETVVVKPFGLVGVDVWFLRPDDPCKCRSHHVEFGRTGGEMILNDSPPQPPPPLPRPAIGDPYPVDPALRHGTLFGLNP
jgi:hypothetical protein